MSLPDILHRLADALASSDSQEVASGVAFTLALALVSYIGAKLTKFTAKGVWGTIRWLTIAKPLSDLAKNLLNVLDSENKKLNTTNSSLTVDDKIVFYGDSCYDPFKGIRIADPNSTPIEDRLSRRDKKIVLRKASAIRDKMVDEFKERVYKENSDLIEKVFSPKKNLCIGVVDTPLPQPSKEIKEREAAVLGCGCLTCQRARGKRA